MEDKKIYESWEASRKAGKEVELNTTNEPESVPGQKRLPFPHLDQMHGSVIPGDTVKEERREVRDWRMSGHVGFWVFVKC